MTGGAAPNASPAAQRAATWPAAGPPRAADGDRGLWIVLGLMTAYSAVHIGFRLLASSSLGEDDPLANLVVQDLRVVYDAAQPPLYDWVLHAVQALTGPTIVSFLAIKYAALIATGAALYAIARRSTGPGITALLAVESLALIYQLSWRFHEGYTHQVGAMLAVAATMWALLRMIDAPHTANAALAGTIAALGALTQPVFLVFAAALALAAVAEREVRARISPMQVAVAALPLIAALGFLVWQAGSGQGSPFVPGRHAFALEWPGWSRASGGFVNALRAPLFYLSPLILIVPLIFRGFLRRAATDLRLVAGFAPPSAAGAPHAPGLDERIVLRTSVIGFVISLLGSAALGLKGYASHVYMPLYITSVVWVMGAVRRTDPDGRALTRFGRLALAIAVFALLARLANMFVLDPVCKICRWGVPYAGLASELAAAGAAHGVIVTPDHELGGNLRAKLPRAAIALPGSRLLDAGSSEHRPPTLAVWSAAMSDGDAERVLQPYLQPGQSAAGAVVVRVPWRHLWRPDGYRVSTWKYLVLDPAAKPVNRVP